MPHAQRPVESKRETTVKPCTAMEAVAQNAEGMTSPESDPESHFRPFLFSLSLLCERRGVASLRAMSQLEPWEMEGSVGAPRPPQSGDNWASSTWAEAPDQEPWESDVELKQRPQMNLHTSTRGMDMLGSLDDIHSPISPPSSPNQRNRSADRHTSTSNNQASDDLSLWQTFKVLYKENPRVKYIIIALVLLLLASLILLGVSLAGRRTQQDCSTAKYNPEPFIIQSPSAPNGKSGEFGASMDASSSYLVVGDPSPKCISQTEGDCSSFTVGGAVYLYRKSSKKNKVWGLYSQFVLDDSLTGGDKFGSSVSISEDSRTLVVGSPMDDGFGVTAGAIYIKEEPFDDNIPPLRLVPDDIGANDNFGGSVAVSITTLPSNNPQSQVKVTNIVAGAASDDDLGSNSGGAYVFSKFEGIPVDGTCGGQDIVVNEWMQCQKLLPDDGGTFDRFARSVHIADRTIVIGTDWDDDMGIDAGAAYVFSLGDDGNWGLQQKLLPSNSDSTANKYGNAVATSGDIIVVGADLDDSQGADSGEVTLVV